ncbi:MAG: trigger factor [Thermodesulfovibrionales bacterium]
MSQTIEDISSTKKRIRIEIPSDVIEKEINDYLETLRQKTKIPGFRQGKAPLHLIQKRFGKSVEAEVLEKVIPEYYLKALKEADILPVTMPVFEDKLEYKKDNPLNISLTVEVMPKIENLDYSDLRVKDIPITVEDSEIEEYLKRLQQYRAIYETVEKDIEKDDLVSFDYVDCEIVGEEISPSIKEKVLKMGKELLPLDIEEKMIGRKKGDTIEFTNTLSELFGIKELAGKTVNAKLVITEVKKKNLPEIDDEFAKDLGFDSLSELKEKIKENIYKTKKDHASKIQKAEILKQIIDSHNFDVPETLLANELEALMIQEGVLSTEEKMRENENIQAKDGEKSKDDLKDRTEELREKAIRNVRASILIDAIGKKEGITVTEEEIKDRINFIAERLSSRAEDIMKFYSVKDGSLEDLRRIIYQEKVLDALLSKASLEEGGDR